MHGVELSRGGVFTPRSHSGRSVVTTPQIIMTIPTSTRSRSAGPRPAPRPGMIGHASEREPARARRFNEASYARPSDPYEVYRDSSNTLANAIGRRVHSHPAAPMSELRAGPPPASLGRGTPYGGFMAGPNDRVSMPHGQPRAVARAAPRRAPRAHPSHNSCFAGAHGGGAVPACAPPPRDCRPRVRTGLLNLDQLLPPRRPQLPASARGSRKKRTSEHATQTISTIGTQTEGGGGSGARWRGTSAAAGGKENGLWGAAAAGSGKAGTSAGASRAASAPRSAVGVGPSPPRAPPSGHASAHASAPGSRRASLAPSSSADQLEQLDSLLHEHQQRLRERVEGARAEQARKQREWFASVGQSLPTPQRAAGGHALGGLDSRLGTAPPTPSRVTVTPTASPRLRAARPSVADAETAPSMCAAAPPRAPAARPSRRVVLMRAAAHLSRQPLRARCCPGRPAARRSSRSPSSRPCSRSSTSSSSSAATLRPLRTGELSLRLMRMAIH